MAKNFSLGEQCLHGATHSKTGPVSFTIELTDGRIVNRHLDQLREDSATSVNGPASTADCNDNSPPQITDQHLHTDTNELRHSKYWRHLP